MAGLLTGSVVLVAMVSSAGSLLGAAPGSLLPLLLPAIVVGTAAVGGMWAGHLRQTRPQVYAGIGHGTPSTNAVPDAINVNI
ncbi:hypothetical protein O3597_04020 [Verrucosispora sp. WMMA2044]|uniref:Uncharacterized protein n=1 Tax=Verrucosispora sioxanthis TaxID=2499994 RepID=A0A6M1LBL4_9ACTN|nr:MULTISPECIES: hypothetical protein [Micromonospora]NEE66532.1 hypothetical protein [Verrucosispora sioxanthis]NGM15642.1 hypothetical protein [Verrucosispora sioxanthis]WBB49663.1 hypothetical protein O3597_04020 [Verrucosispora sp. WMMA2044]